MAKREPSPQSQTGRRGTDRIVDSVYTELRDLAQAKLHAPGIGNRGHTKKGRRLSTGGLLESLAEGTHLKSVIFFVSWMPAASRRTKYTPAATSRPVGSHPTHV